jgi:predicted Zn-dependent protease
MKKAVELSPRNETYQINLANVYMANRRVDEAIALLQLLASSADPQISDRATTTLAQAQKIKDPVEVVSIARSRDRNVRARAERTRYCSGLVRQSCQAEDEAGKPAAPPAVRFIKGKITGVDCSVAPAALLTFVSGKQAFEVVRR